MANVDIRVGKKDAVFFSANPTLILKDGQFLFNSDTLELFIGDGTTQLSALVAINVPPSSGVQSVTGPQVDDTDPNNPIVNPLGLIQIVDLNGDFFTDLATATAYIEQYFNPSIITDKSFNNGVFYFTVPSSTSTENVVVGFLSAADGISTNSASFVDEFGLVSFFYSASNFERNSGNHIMGNVDFQLGDFNEFSGIAQIKSIIGIGAALNYFGLNSTGKFIIEGNLGSTETANFGATFFSGSTATIFANASKYTSNAGGIQGDLVTAITNGCNVQFEGINLEKVSNKSTSVVTDQASNTKYPSVKSVFDWVTALFATKGNSRPIYSGKRRSIPYVGMPANSTGNQGNIWYIPYIVDSTHIVTDIGLEVTTAIAATNIRLALYYDNNGVPGSLIEESAAISSASTGLKTHTFATPKTLSASNQIYWMAFQCSAFAVGLRATATAVNNLYITGIGAIGSVYSQSQAFGAFPANATPVNFSSSSSWLVSLKVQ